MVWPLRIGSPDPKACCTNAVLSMRSTREPRTPPNSADERVLDLYLCGICCGWLLLGMDTLDASARGVNLDTVRYQKPSVWNVHTF